MFTLGSLLRLCVIQLKRVQNVLLKVVFMIIIISETFGLSSGTKAALQTRPSWNTGFHFAINALKGGAYAVARDIDMIRLITDHAIPGIVLPNGVIIEQKHILVPGQKGGLPSLICEKYSFDLRHICCPNPKCARKILLPSTEARRLRCKKCKHEWQFLTPQASDTTILYIHGGAFATCSSSTHRALLSEIVLSTRANIFAIDYRRPPEFPFPAALEDSVRAYLALVEMRGIPSSKIIIAGDSAGGGLSISTMVALRDQHPAVGLPAGAALLSPWVDLSDYKSPTWQANKYIDYLPNDLCQLFAQSYAGATDKKHPLLSPTFAELKQLPPMLVEVGECEVLRHQILKFVEKARAAGVTVENTIAVDMVHVYQLLTNMADAKQCPQPRQSLARIADFICRTIHIPAPVQIPSNNDPQVEDVFTEAELAAGHIILSINS